LVVLFEASGGFFNGTDGQAAAVDWLARAIGHAPAARLRPDFAYTEKGTLHEGWNLAETFVPAD
jgi:hypothetical protein